jgi:predicted dehydrogenase
VLKVAIVGCGKIADAHASQIVRIAGCEIVAVCDREPLMAKQLWRRFPVRHCFQDLPSLLEEARPDVVHITTPAETHYGLARLCLERGSHVYIEKPITLRAQEAETLIALAESRGLKLTAGHDAQFSHVTRRMRALIRDGYLGGPPVHMESSYCYDLSDPAYARALLTDKTHWVRQLPGKLLQNIISHGVARIAEFLATDSPEVVAHGFVSPLLRSMGETEIVDELRVMISEQGGATAYFTFSSQMRPTLHEFRIYGPRNGLALDQDQETLIKLPGERHKSFAEKFVPPAALARQYLGNLKTNLGIFLRNDFHMAAGIKCLIESFYRSIADDAPPPIPYREILLTARIMDRIFDQVGSTVPSTGRESRAAQQRVPLAMSLGSG